MRKLLNEELNRPSAEAFRQSEKMPLVVVLDGVRSHLNVGSVFRTCDAFAVQAVYLCGITGTPPHRDIQKTALGATETVSWRYFQHTVEAIRALREDGYFIASVEQAENATSLEKVSFSGKKMAVVFGNEVDGVLQEVVSASDQVIEIPQWGTKHSLNIAVSAGIVIWELARKFRF